MPSTGNHRKPRTEFLVFGAPVIEEEEIQEVTDCLRSGWIGTGPRVTKFEEAFRAYKDGASHAVALNSCTAGLHLSLLAAGVKPGDEVITTAMTFCATVNSIIHVGAVPVLVDVDPRTFNIDVSQIKAKITPRTKVLMPVHFAGRPCDMDAIMAIAKEHGLMVIEDCAHAIDTEYHGKKAGTFGDFGCFSFYVTKSVITGEGGIVLTKRQEDKDRIRRLSLHGMSQDAWKRFSSAGYKHYQVDEPGFKFNMMDLQASLGLVQLKKAKKFWQRRKQVWERYMQELEGLPLVLPAPIPADIVHDYHLFTMLIDPKRSPRTRDQVLEGMTAAKIGVGVHYTCVAEFDYYRERFGWAPEQFPVATHVGRHTLSIPLSPRLSDDDVSDVIAALRDCLSH